jgi:hypothetical protein
MNDECARLAQQTLQQAKGLEPGPQRDALESKAREYQAKAASGGLRSSKLHLPR